MTLRDDVFNLLLKNERRTATEIIRDEILEKNHIYTTKDDKAAEMWIYENGIYVPQGRSFIKEYVRNILGEIYTTTLCNEIIYKIEADTFIKPEEFFINNNLNEIPVENGILNIFTKELNEFTPTKIFFTKIPVLYDKTKTCPNILKFLKDVLKDEEDIKVVLEIIGYCLLKEYKLEKAFMFLGNGRNGKSKTLTLLKLFLGMDNVCSIPLYQLRADNFSISELHNKLVNIAGDLSNTDLKDTGMIKSLTGRDPINAKRKFLSDVKFTNFAKMVFACNDLPRVYDTSIGFWERWVLLEFPYQFVKKKEYDLISNEKDKEFKKVDNPDIINSIISKDELSGLLNESLEALQRINEEKDFSYTKGSKEVKDFWVRKSDSFMAFCLDEICEDYDSKISKKEVRQKYSKYCKKHKVKSVSDISIKITLQELYGVIDEFIKTDPLTERQEWCWTGIKWKNEI